MRKGTINCFPESEREANKMAEALVEKLNKEVGGNWEGRVWKNGQWCYDAKLGSIAIKQYIHPQTGENTYSAYMSDEIGRTGGTPSYYSSKNNYDRATPKEAVDSIIGNAQAVIDNLQAVIDDNKKLMKK